LQQKTITVVIDEKGNSSVDLDGFAGQGCEKVLKDFQGQDQTRVSRKKAAFYNQTSALQERLGKAGK
jgi:hypothetical protein